jgi:2-oxoglutarate dehydrogenase E1 component
MDKFSYLSNATPESIDALYQQYLNEPASLDEGWQKFFEGFEFARINYDIKPGGEVPSEFLKEFKVLALINGYRQRGHLFTQTNPVRERRKYNPTLDIENFGLEKSDLNTVFQAGSEIGIGPAPLHAIVERLQAIYCGHIGIEFLYVRDPQKIEWLKTKFDALAFQPEFTKEKRTRILKKLNQAVGFEKYLHKKFVGQKRFSLEGGESIIPALEVAVQNGSELGIEEFVVGMAHRGRLNVLANIFDKPYQKIFNEFEGYFLEDERFDGDVKYHLGYNNTVTLENGKKVEMNLLPNPSHLETVGAIAEGLARSIVDTKFEGENKKVCPILIHGDAAVAGQGIVYELLQMSKLPGYKTGGTIHLVINNQVGFTTNYLEARSSTYCTDIAKVVLTPVFHVNADDVEAVVKVMELAMEYRQRYREDIFIDLLGYRKHGHNEGDEPRFTQPILYKAIDKHPDPFQIYSKELIAKGIFTAAEVSQVEKDFNAILDNNLEKAKTEKKGDSKLFLEHLYKEFRQSGTADFEKSPATSLTKKKAVELLEKINFLPEGKNFNRKITKIFADRATMVKENRLDWALGELLAYASLLDEGRQVRLTGQDVVRGTFSHRHAILRLEDTEEDYTPLNNLNEKQAKFIIYNSLLSEYAVLGFEYGYALGVPNGLTLWEAQFGDFNNGAQIVIDQYISAAEDKWKTQNGLVMLLPHGYEGQGAEHSSARLERFLTLCAEQNMQVVNCTSPANFFHALRRQVARPFRKPLVVMSPKSLLRHPECVSKLEEFTSGGFQEIIDDKEVDVKNVEKLIFCSGKIYFELLEERRKNNIQNIAIVRVEQLFPWPVEQAQTILKKYNKAEKIEWVQEEPENMGPWGYILRLLSKSEKHINIDVVSPPASASPATGSSKMSTARQRAVIEAAIGITIEA